MLDKLDQLDQLRKMIECECTLCVRWREINARIVATRVFSRPLRVFP